MCIIVINESNRMSILSRLANYVEYIIKILLTWVTNFLPVKTIRDHNGVPFLYRYHLFALSNDGPGLCIHRFVKSDPDRGYHDHPWKKSMSFILAGGYEERLLNLTDNKSYDIKNRNRWTFNYLKGTNNFHRVMMADKKDAWTIFAFSKRNKVWGIIGLDGEYKAMSTKVMDTDGGWWNYAGTGFAVNNHVPLSGIVSLTADAIVTAEDKVLLIKRGKDPFKDCWAFPGGRVEQKDKDILAAANRELKEETNLEVDLKYFTIVGNNTRDPRGFCATSVYTAELDSIPINTKAGDDAVDYHWFPLNDLPTIAFDHREILDSFIKKDI